MGRCVAEQMKRDSAHYDTDTDSRNPYHGIVSVEKPPEGAGKECGQCWFESTLQSVPSE